MTLNAILNEGDGVLVESWVGDGKESIHEGEFMILE